VLASVAVFLCRRASLFTPHHGILFANGAAAVAADGRHAE
jgi:hypothetical protein